MKQLTSGNLSNLSLNYNWKETGTYGLILIRYTGVAQAGKTVALADLGNIRFTRKGEDKINVPASILSALDNVYGGAIEATSAAGGAFAFSIIIPTGLWFDPSNVYSITGDDRVSFNLSFPNMDAVLIVSGNATIYALPKAGQMTYIHKILSANIIAGGAQTVTDTISENNISEVYLVDPATLLTNIQLSKNGGIVYNGDVGSELAYSNWIHQLESTVTTLALEFVTSMRVMEALGTPVSYNFQFSGAGTQEMYYSAVELIK